jgi:hypothetical protein
MRKRIFATLLAILVVGSGLAPMAAAAGGGLNFDSGNAPNPTLHADTTVQEYQVSWGDSLQYEDDSGDVVNLPAEINRSTDPDDLGNGTVNPFAFKTTDIKFADAGEFPRNDDENGENSASALDASEYTTSGATVSDTTTAPGVDAVQFEASASGDQATYDNFSVSSDAEKRYVQVFYDVPSASAGNVDLIVHDATDGDTATVKLFDADGLTNDANVGANSTGEGKAVQVQVGTLSATGGDNTIDEIGKIVINADGAATVDMSAVNLEKTGEWKLGERNVENSDDELETEDAYEATGEIRLDSLSTMGATFDDATIMGITVPTEFSAEQAPDDDVMAMFNSDNAYPNWDSLGDIYYRLELPSAYDLSYANTELRAEQNWPETRYATVQIQEDAGDTEFSEIDNWSEVTSSFSNEGDSVTLDSTVSADTEYAINYQLKLTGDEASAMQASGGGGAGLLGGGGGGGIIDSVLSIPGMIISSIAAFLGLRARGS